MPEKSFALTASTKAASIVGAGLGSKSIPSISGVTDIFPPAKWSVFALTHGDPPTACEQPADQGDRHLASGAEHSQERRKLPDSLKRTPI